MGPSASPTRGSAPLRPDEGSLPPDDGPLKLLFSSPQGDDVEAPVPTLVFSRSMHRLGDPPSEPAVVATIDPPVEGTWHWVGSRALQFSPRKGFQRATGYTIEVRPGLRSLDGQTVNEPVRLAFATPALRLVNHSLGDGPSDPIVLSFSQPVSPEALQKAIAVRDEDARPIEVQVTSTETATELRIRPRKRWPEDKMLRVSVSRSLHGVSGPRGLPADAEFTLRHHDPVVVRELQCQSHREGDVCEDDTSLRVELSDIIDLAALRPLIRIDPPLPFTLRGESGEPKGPDNAFLIDARFRLGVTYKVSIRSSSARNQRQRGLDQGATLTFHTEPPRPWVSLLAHGTYVRPEWTRELHATMGRHRKATFTVTPLSLDDVLAQVRDEKKPLQGERKSREVVDPTGKGAWDSTNLADLLPATPGPVFIEAAVEGPTGKSGTRHEMQRTDLAISSRLARESSIVWVTHLATGEPVAGAEVTVMDLEDHKLSARTDAQGVAKLDLSGFIESESARRKPRWARDRGKVVLTARLGDDWMYTLASLPPATSLQGNVFLDRMFYRPGETIHIKGTVRQTTSNGTRTPAGREVQLKLNIPGSSQVSIPKKLSEWGTFYHQYQIPGDAPPNGASIDIYDGAERLTSTRLDIRAFRAQSFKVESSLDRAEYKVGDTFRCQGSAQYLYGGSMRDSKFSTVVTMRPEVAAIEGQTGFLLGDHDSPWSPDQARTKHTQSGKLDGAGRFQAQGDVTLDLDRQGKPMTLSCETSVRDVGEQQVTSTSTAYVHPAEFYIAVSEPPSSRVEPGQTIQPRLRALSPRGQRRAEKITLKLLEKSDKENVRPALLSSCTVTTAVDHDVTCPLKIPTRHNVPMRVEASSVDSRGHLAITNHQLWTRERELPSVRQNSSLSKPLPPPPPPLLQADRYDRKVGETASFAFSPLTPFVSGLFTVEREGVLEHRVFASTQTGPFTVPLTDVTAPQIDAVVELSRALPPGPPRSRPARLTEDAHAHVSVQPADRSLKVELTPSRTEAAPGDMIDVDVLVQDQQGAGVLSEVTLYAVDEGTLMLGFYEVPDLTWSLGRFAEHLVRSHETRSQIGWLPLPVRGGRLGGSHTTRPPQIRMGATTVSGPEGPRRDFTPTPLFRPDLLTDERGHARVSFKLPDSLTAYRIMAVAVTKADRFGRAQASLTTSLPTQLRPLVPLAIRAGDRFDVAAVAANNTQETIEVAASMTASGFTVNPEAQPLRLAPGASERVTFPAVASHVGPGKLSFRLASGDRTHDSAEIPLEVQSPTMLEASALHGSTAASVEESVADLRTIRPDVGWLDLTVSSSAVAGLAPGLEQLVEYPYGCTEQMTSRLVPLLSLRDVARSLRVALPPDVDDVSKKTVEKILRNRSSDGRFGLWPSSTPTPWITTYALWGLSEAHRRGILVDRAIFEKASQSLQEVAAGWHRGPGDAANACFALDVLADLPGLDDTVRSHALILARQIADHPDDAPPFARALLLHALVRLGVTGDELTPPLRSLEASLHLDGAVARVVEPGEYFHEQLDSRVRSSALALRALLAAAPKHPMLKPLALGLIADRGPRGWRTTQEATWALLALDAFRQTDDAGAGDLGVHVALGSRSLLDTTLSGVAEQTTRVPMDTLAQSGGGSLLFAATGGGKLHYQARLRYAPTTPPATPISAGIEVTRRCRPIPEEGTEPAEFTPTTTFSVGQSIQCEVEVVTPSPRRFVAIDDPIPGGFELLDPSVIGFPPRLRKMFTGSYDRRELRADRVVYFVDHLTPGIHRWSYVARAMTSGDFSVPPTRAEEMYAPEIFGRTAASRVRITP